MGAWLRRLSPGGELALVLLVAFGAVVPRSLAALVGGLAAPASPPITNGALIGTAIYELVVLVVLAPFLRLRGWTPARLGLTPGITDTALGVPLAAAAYLGYLLLAVTAIALAPGLGRIAHTQLVSGGLGWPAVLLVSLVNPLFEELFLCGYPISALKERFGPTAALNVSAAVRVFCHFYQGALGVLGIVPLALVFGYWYARTGRLWPLIVAHAMLDLAGLLAGR